jgi:hypothetical protein
MSTKKNYVGVLFQIYKKKSVLFRATLNVEKKSPVKLKRYKIVIVVINIDKKVLATLLHHIIDSY